MAEALIAEDTRVCDQCRCQISLNDWTTHRTLCQVTRRDRFDHDDDDDDEASELSSAKVPCEFCELPISFHVFDTHTRRCAELHQRRLAEHRRKAHEELNALLIPCEFCDQSFLGKDLEEHSRQCRSTIKKTNDEPIIPCEYCSEAIGFYLYDEHLKTCRDEHRAKQLAEWNRHATTDQSLALIPCERCHEPFPFAEFSEHQKQCQSRPTAIATGFPRENIFGTTIYPETWDLSSFENLRRFPVDPQSAEFAMVAGKFNESLRQHQIVMIERIQNCRWYRQYDAHRDDFIERYGNSTEQWLFHGCRGQSVDLIIKDCFNRSHATRCAVGQGIYFATQAAISLSYTQPDAHGERHMFMARVLVGKTTGGNATTKVCPPGFDTTGGGNVFVTYHDAQAYGEYLITFR